MPSQRRRASRPVETEAPLIGATFCMAFLFAFLPCTHNLSAQRAGAALAVPSPCAVLTARYKAGTQQTAPRLPRDMDTDRIQNALDLCMPGQAVILRGDGTHTGFLSGPLVIKRGVTLFIQTGTTLYASANLRDYDFAPFSCGAAKANRPQCKPFIFSYQAAYSGVMGTGTIDGQAIAIARILRPVLGARSLPSLIAAYESYGFRIVGLTLRNAIGTDVSITKTQRFKAFGISIDSWSTRSVLPALVLTNCEDSSIDRVHIHNRGEAIVLRASILGPTRNIDLRDIAIREGSGIRIGDPRYGGVYHVALQSVKLMDVSSALTLQAPGTLAQAIRDVHLSKICMENVADPWHEVSPSGEVRETRFPPEIVTLDQIERQPETALSRLDKVDEQAGVCGSFRVARADKNAIFAAPTESVKLPGTRHALVVAQDGSGDFRSVQAAVNALPNDGGTIQIEPGTYRETVTIRKPHVTLHGDSLDRAAVTIVEGHNAAGSGGTFNSATVFVEADDVSLDYMTIANDVGNGRGQGVALAATGDRDVFRSLEIRGHQDTLFAASKYCYGDYGPCVPARQYFQDCLIDGNVDFIFGDSIAVFDDCTLHGNAHGNVMFTAQGRHSSSQVSGYVFNDCTLTSAPRTHGTVSLGRPWRPYATVVYLRARINAAVLPQGWTEWPRFGVPSLPTAFYAEYQSSGPGADQAVRERYSHQLTAQQAESFSPAEYLAGEDGWDPTAQARAIAQ